MSNMEVIKSILGHPHHTWDELTAAAKAVRADYMNAVMIIAYQGLPDADVSRDDLLENAEVMALRSAQYMGASFIYYGAKAISEKPGMGKALIGKDGNIDREIEAAQRAGVLIDNFVHTARALANTAKMLKETPEDTILTHIQTQVADDMYDRSLSIISENEKKGGTVSFSQDALLTIVKDEIGILPDFLSRSIVSVFERFGPDNGPVI